MQTTQHARIARPRIVIAATEHRQLWQLAERAQERDEQSHVVDFLVDELSRAYIVPDGACATNVVQIGSDVTYREESTSRVRRVKLVFPHEANIDHNRVSVLTPIGAALIGLTIAQTIEWPAPAGRREALTVLDVSNAREVSVA
jgi:regulator of nucleoside diphosphate kinase